MKAPKSHRRQEDIIPEDLNDDEPIRGRHTIDHNCPEQGSEEMKHPDNSQNESEEEENTSNIIPAESPQMINDLSFSVQIVSLKSDKISLLASLQTSGSSALGTKAFTCPTLLKITALFIKIKK